jgi:hypothetical protein
MKKYITMFKFAPKQFFVMERVIAAEPVKITVGISTKLESESTNNLYRRQCIKIGNDNKLYPLLSCSETPDNLCFKFEDNVDLNLMKKNNDIVYNIKTNNLNETNVMNNTVRNFYKSISFNSNELDKIADFIKPNKN